jgi:hypothetical protein
LRAQITGFEQRLLRPPASEYIGMAGTDWLEAPLASVPGNALPQVPAEEPYRNVLSMEEAQQRTGSFHNRGRDGLGNENGPPGTNSSSSATTQVDTKTITQIAHARAFAEGHNSVPQIAGEENQVDWFALTQNVPGQTPNVNTTRPSVPALNLDAPPPTRTVETKATEPFSQKIMRFINTAPEKVLDMLRTATSTQQGALLNSITKAWIAGAIAAAAMPVLAADPFVREHFVLVGVPMVGQGYGRGKHKRKRSVSRGRGRGRGAAKPKRHRH